jgi:hypothetical protein
MIGPLAKTSSGAPWYFDVGMAARAHSSGQEAVGGCYGQSVDLFQGTRENVLHHPWCSETDSAGLRHQNALLNIMPTLHEINSGPMRIPSPVAKRSN